MTDIHDDADVAIARRVATTLAGPLADPDDAALARVRARVDARASAPRRRWAWLVAVPATAVAVSAGVVAVAVMLPPPSPEPSPAPPPGSSIAPTTVDQFVAPVRDDCTITSMASPRWSRIHWGADLACPTGTPFYAVHSGTVTWAGYDQAYGLHVVLDVGDGVVFIYAHASELRVAAGDEVNAGDVLGHIGATGYATGPHLHLEVRVRDGYYDTARFLREHGAGLLPPPAPTPH